MPQSEYIMNIFYIIGVIVVVLFVAGFFGLHAWTKSLAAPARSWIQVANFEPKHGERERCADRIGENDHQIVFRNAIDKPEAWTGRCATSIFSDRSDVEFRGIAFLSCGNYENKINAVTSAGRQPA
jgi:hypothetical protein